MKTNQKSNIPFAGAVSRKNSKTSKTSAGKNVSAHDFHKNEDELIVIKDVTSGKEYYLSVVDTFMYAKKEYIVTYNYVPDDGEHKKPELVIMRSEFSEKGDQLFYSIKDKDELEIAFSYFMRRYYNSRQGEEDRRNDWRSRCLKIRNPGRAVRG